MRKYVAEFFGSAVLVLIGCGAIAIGGFGNATHWPLAIMPIAMSFGLAVMVMAYTIGPISGCHINPAVTLGMWAAGRMPASEVGGYIVGQILGSIAGAGLLVVLLSSKSGGYDLAAGGLGQNGWGEGYLGGYGMGAAILAEAVATFIFVSLILAVTRQEGGAGPLAGLIIGLTLLVLHFPFIEITGLSVNPVRSLAPALFVGGKALAQVWLFLIVPSVAGCLAGLPSRGMKPTLQASPSRA
jgi:aquaporin Z